MQLNNPVEMAFGLPPVPEGVNPFVFYGVIGSPYFALNAGFGARLVVLLCLVG